MTIQRHRWTRPQLALLKELWEGGSTIEEITEALSPHTIRAIKAMAHERRWTRPAFGKSKYLAYAQTHVYHSYRWTL